MAVLWLATAGYVAALALGSLASPSEPAGGGWDTRISPTIQNTMHAPAYAGLTLLLVLTLWYTWQRQAWHVLLAASAASTIGLLMECAQLAVEGRTASVSDAILNTFGAVTAGVVILLATNRGLVPRLCGARSIYWVALAAILYLALPAYLWSVALESGSRAWWMAAIFFTVTQALLLSGALYKLLRWHTGIWLGEYLTRRAEPASPNQPLDVILGIMDHFEPCHGQVDSQQQMERVRTWQDRYAAAIRGHCDSDGRCPRHTWFVPVGLVTPGLLPFVAQWQGLGWGELEYHLHHDDQPAIEPAKLEAVMRAELAELQAHGAIPEGRYGFVHGMFALAGGDPRYCRVSNELDLLIRTGCYADFTFPTLSSAAQPRQVNSIYYASTTSHRKPYNRGQGVRVGGNGQGLMLIPGPMCIGASRNLLHDGELAARSDITERTVRSWIRAHVHVTGRPEWVYVLLHTHSAPESYQHPILERTLPTVWSILEKMSARQEIRLHYMTAREIYNTVKAAEAGERGNPTNYRDVVIAGHHPAREQVQAV